MATTTTPQCPKPELLCPAGDLEKLKIALLYGADAVYVGGHIFGLRRYATNFTSHQLQQGINFANQYNKKVYVVLNGFAHQSDLDQLKSHLLELNTYQPHGLIISDMGVFQLAKTLTSLPLHISTQASVTNYYACQFWKDHGASRIILAREVGIADCQTIQKFCDIELEVFVHGAMCASYSGKCTISNYTAGRDSNRGGCIQSCRHHYAIQNPDNTDTESTLSMMNAKDLMGIRQLPALIQARLSSLKIEGRMKSNLYVANCATVYRHAIDTCYEAVQNQSVIPESQFLEWESTLSQVSNRTFSSGALAAPMAGESIHYQFNQYEKSVDYLGTVKDIADHNTQPLMIVAVKNSFNHGDTIDIMTPDGQLKPLTITTLQNSKGDPINKTNPNTIVKLNAVQTATPYSILINSL